MKLILLIWTINAVIVTWNIDQGFAVLGLILIICIVAYKIGKFCKYFITELLDRIEERLPELMEELEDKNRK